MILTHQPKHCTVTLKLNDGDGKEFVNSSVGVLKMIFGKVSSVSQLENNLFLAGEMTQCG